MRVPGALFALTICMLAGAAAAESGQRTRASSASSASHCRPTRSYLADRNRADEGQRLRPRKLTELPPGTAYMAVFRHIGGCEAPLTMVDYRNPRRR
jgi:hypothetical protein